MIQLYRNGEDQAKHHAPSALLDPAIIKRRNAFPARSERREVPLLPGRKSKILFMNRRRWLVAVAFLALFGAARPALAAKILSTEKMAELLATLHGKPDGKVAGELGDVQLTERVSAARLARWEAEFPGARTHEELVKLADMSAYLDLPATDVVDKPRPDVKTQLSILSLVVHYVADTMPRLPDFYATRITTHFEYTPSQLIPQVEAKAVLLRPAGAFTRIVTYRDGKEIPYENARRLKEESPLLLTTSGEFGPILIVVVGDALHGKVQWLRWEQGAAGPVAVFSYAVPQTNSHFVVGVAVSSKSQEILPAYHGEITIDPETGAVLRLSQIADMTPPHDETSAAIAVDYGPVTISGRRYICPTRSVAFSQFPDPSGRPFNTSLGDKILWPIKTELNDVAFTNYHEFGSEARIVTNPSAGNDSNAAGGSGTPAPELSASAAESGASSAEVAAQTTSSPDAALPAPSVGMSSEAAALAPPNSSPALSAAAPAANSAAGSSSQAPVAPVASTDSKPATETADAVAPPPNASVAADVPAAPTVLHTQSKLVLVDVVVTDHGKPVTGLDRSRFHVFQDGHEQDITSFDESGAGKIEPADAGAAVVRPPALPPDTYSNQPAYPKANSVNVLLLDGLNTEATDEQYVRREMVSYLKTLPPGQGIAIFTLGSKLRLIQGFTADTGKLLAALADKMATPAASLRQSPEQKAEDQAEIDRMIEANASPLDIANTRDFLNDAQLQQAGMRMDLTLKAFQELARYLGGIPGRKNLVWFSGSFPLQFFAIGSDPIRQMAMNADGAFGEQVRDTANLLAAERVAVYPVDARGVLVQSTFEASVQAQDYSRSASVNSLGGGTNRFAQDTQLEALQTGSEHATMDVLAQETGGRAVHDSNGLKEALAEALTDGSNFYSVAYVPPEIKNGQRGVVFHSIEVKLDGAKYQLAYRRGYYTDDPSKDAEHIGKISEAMTEAAVLGVPPSTQILFQARVRQVEAPEGDGATPNDNAAGEKTTSFPGGAERYAVDLKVPLQNLSIAEGAGGHAQLETALVAYNDEGQIVNSLGRAFRFDIPPDQYQKLMAAGGAISAYLALDLPARDLVLRIVVYDPASARTGSLEVPVKIAGKQARSETKGQTQ
jgi:VWFA-related protein